MRRNYSLKIENDVGFLGLLTLLFLALKLCGVVTWSWWAVFAPMWIPTAIAFAIVLLVLSGMIFTVGAVAAIKK